MRLLEKKRQANRVGFWSCFGQQNHRNKHVNRFTLKRDRKIRHAISRNKKEQKCVSNRIRFGEVESCAHVQSFRGNLKWKHLCGKIHAAFRADIPSQMKSLCHGTKQKQMSTSHSDVKRLANYMYFLERLEPM